MIFMEVLETSSEIIISMVLLREEILLFHKQTDQNVSRSLHPTRKKVWISGKLWLFRDEVTSKFLLRMDMSNGREKPN